MSDDTLFALPPLQDGGGLALAACPGRERPVAEDIAAYAAWGATDVLSLVEPAEFADEAGLEAALARAGIAWHRLPIPDYGVPPSEEAWRAVAEGLHASLDRGGRVVAHCWGGKGRSGMAAARLLVERGTEAAEAQATVRAARPGAVETPEQEAWVARSP